MSQIEYSFIFFSALPHNFHKIPFNARNNVQLVIGHCLSKFFDDIQKSGKLVTVSYPWAQKKFYYFEEGLIQPDNTHLKSCGQFRFSSCFSLRHDKRDMILRKPNNER